MAKWVLHDNLVRAVAAIVLVQPTVESVISTISLVVSPIVLVSGIRGARLEALVVFLPSDKKM